MRIFNAHLNQFSDKKSSHWLLSKKLNESARSEISILASHPQTALDIMHPSNFPEQDFKYRIGDNTQGPPAKSSLSGSDEEKDEGDSISETDQTPLNSEGNDEDWLDVQPGGF